jgi:hypothetical protein
MRDKPFSHVAIVKAGRIAPGLQMIEQVGAYRSGRVIVPLEMPS